MQRSAHQLTGDQGIVSLAQFFPCFGYSGKLHVSRLYTPFILNYWSSTDTKKADAGWQQTVYLP